jgi:uncharacterized protein YbcC (UPF0753/DUF2309 family)
MLEKTLLKIKTYIPTYWPLQSFIAVNPLYGLTHHSFNECMIKLSKFIAINGALNFDYYHQSYANGKIGLNSLDLAIKEFLQDKKIFNKNNNDVLLNLLIDSKNQIILEQETNNEVNNNSILISNTIEQTANYFENKKIEIQISKFLADFFDLGQAKWRMPVTITNLYEAWIEYNNVGNIYIKSAIAEIQSKDKVQTIKYLVEKLQITNDCLEQYFIEIIFRIIGWSGFIKWLEERPDNPYVNKTAEIYDILAMWLILEYALHLEHGCLFNHKLVSNHNNKNNHILKEQLLNFNTLYNQLNNISLKLIWQRALEIEYKNNILNQIKLTQQRLETASHDIKKISKSQIVFCIDTRSEGIRRKLESIDNYQTFGFAGFFGVGFQMKDQETNLCSLQCPAIVNPDITLINKFITKNSLLEILLSSICNTLNKVKSKFFAPLVLFDMVGMFFSIILFCKTIFPNKLNKLFKISQEIKFSNTSINVFDKSSGFTPYEIAEKAQFVLNAIGLINNFAPFVIIAGHIAESANNPFQSSLDCGACGGNSGIPNAIAFCQGLNNAEVRQILLEKYAINIPQTTFFVSSCHNTTLDKFYYYNLESMNKLQQDSFNTIINDINDACDLLRTERLSVLYGDKNVNIRKSNWSELIPEIALANNASFIIAPRKITQNINLDRRTFLHSYEPDLDPEGDILSFIFNAPVIVGHWINSQYYFSTTDNKIYGAGNKAIHNLLGGFGVMEGNFSHLKMGLPEQSVFYRKKLMHQPLKLTVFVYAKKQLVLEIINKSPQLKNLFNGRWINLEILEELLEN